MTDFDDNAWYKTDHPMEFSPERWLKQVEPEEIDRIHRMKEFICSLDEDFTTARRKYRQLVDNDPDFEKSMGFI